jgi:hypothetical protein
MRPLTLLLALAVTSSLSAQDFDTTTVFGRVMQRRSDRIRQNPAFQAAGVRSHMTEADLSRLEDSDLVRMAGLMFRTMMGPNGDCTNLESQPKFDIQDMLDPGMDSLEAESWAGVMERLAALVTDSSPPRLAATPEQASALFRALYNHADGKERLTFDKAVAVAGTAPCRFFSWLVDRIMVKPPATAAPIVRQFFAIGHAQRSKP